MPRPRKKTINTILQDEYQALIKTHHPIFGNQDDIDIAEYHRQLQSKSLSPDQRNSLLSKIIYLLKK